MPRPPPGSSGTVATAINVGNTIGWDRIGSWLGLSKRGAPCSGQAALPAVVHMLGQLSPADQTTLSEAWSQSVRGVPIPWADPAKLAQQARGGDGCRISGNDHYFVQAFNTLMARYPLPGTEAGWYQSGATPTGTLPGTTPAGVVPSYTGGVNWGAHIGSGDSLPSWAWPVLAALAVLLILKFNKG